MIFFIIPHRKIGGAEKVHLEIMKSVYQYEKIFFVIYDTDNSPISDDFLKIATIVNLNSSIKRRIFKYLIILISYIIPITVFGCNIGYFYYLLPKISKKSTTIDLTHAFSFSDTGREDIALNYIPLIDQRIVINKKTFTDYENEYRSAGIDAFYLNRFKIIPNGIPINNFDDKLIEKRFHDFTIGFVGRFSYEKRPELFLSLASSLFQNRIKVKMIVDNFKLSKSIYDGIEIVEGINDSELVNKEFSTISVLIVPSLREGFPLVIMEAMELGIPVISTAVGSIDEHVIDGENGYISDNIESEIFVKFCFSKIELLSIDKELYTSISLSARAYAETNFNIYNFYDAYRKILLKRQ